ncbi:MAG TPA: glycosyltransferase [Candidatus Baltobacteraceae bacterium]
MAASRGARAAVNASIVIPAYNAERTLPETLRALHAQAGCTPLETIVVDNASTDGTAHAARGFGVTVLFESRRGPAAARNCGLNAARGEIVVFCDADTVPSRRWLAELTRPFDDDGVVIAAGNTLCYPPKTGAERYVQAIGLYDAALAANRDPFPFAPSLNVAVRAHAARAIGGFNVELMTGEDVDFSHRLKRRFGAAIAYAPRAVLYHHARATDEELRRQARGYGAGVADLYAMYPDEVGWNAGTALRLLGVLSTRPLRSAAAQVAAQLGWLDASRAEFLRYQAMWTKSFWLGFYQRVRERRIAA